jgi:16S rRNA (cytosine967-C5)-methyltransferase
VTPGAQVAAAIDILAAIADGSRPADDVAADYFRRRRYIGAKDRQAIAAHVYAVLRHRAALDWWIARAARGDVPPSPRSRVFAAMLLAPTPPSPASGGGSFPFPSSASGGGSFPFPSPASGGGSGRGWTAANIEACCAGERFRPPLTPAEAKLLRGLAGHTLRHPEMPRTVANDVPDWLGERLVAVFGDALEREMAALNAPAPTDLRVNLLKADREAARRALAAEGIEAAPTPLSPLGLRLMARAPLAGLAAFRGGLVEVQDEGSQLAALLVGARPGMRVVDFCAGAGGKTLALAAGMANRGRLVALDVSERRLERAALRLRRAGVGNVERRAMSSERDKWVKHHAGTFDRVLVDAPCLGTGTWRRNPDAKWRMTPQDLDELRQRQQDILQSAARLVRPGGRLVYATCSLLREEDEAQAEAFLAAAPDFAPVPMAGAWPEAIGGASPGGDTYLRLTPARHGTDGFFVAIFARRAAA